MRKSAKILSFLLVVVVLMFTLASCGSRLSGTYETDEVLGSKTSYTFDGNEVTIKITIIGVSTELTGTYAIEDDEITFTFGEDEDAKTYSGTHSFEKGDGYIKIGDTKLKESK